MVRCVTYHEAHKLLVSREILKKIECTLVGTGTVDYRPFESFNRKDLTLQLRPPVATPRHKVDKSYVPVI